MKYEDTPRKIIGCAMKVYSALFKQEDIAQKSSGVYGLIPKSNNPTNHSGDSHFCTSMLTTF